MYNKAMDTDPIKFGSESSQPATPQPVAYDMNGRPLYAATPNSPQDTSNPAPSSPSPPITPDIKAKHDESVQRFPALNLSDGEYVISAIQRHWIGLVVPAVLTVFVVAFIMSVAINYPLIASSLGFSAGGSYAVVLLIGSLLSLIFLIGGYIAIWVYTNNRFIVTNESVIEDVQNSLFSRREQTVNLGDIRDVSFRQDGLLPMMLNYGSIRLSIEGDEAVYRFQYVTNPKNEATLLNNAREAYRSQHPSGD